ncbi:MAG TPA: ABC transporter transmembrane domain-containing protein [Flexilinea sp.]|nr:ABC transporter transmembrane domain-containing protein [Flexilinea sp.]
MQRLLKYLKPFIFLLILAIALLFLQANADLALPDYLSKIVNVGIQAGGIENAIPQAIRQTEMERLMLFFSAEEKERVLNDYTLVDQSSPDYNRYLSQYPALKDGAIYVLNPIDQAETDWLNPVMAKALLVVYGIEQGMADPTKVTALGQMNFNGFDISKLPPGTDLFKYMGQMPPAALSQISESINKRLEAMGSSSLIQAAAAPIQAEYAALGMDVGAVSHKYILNTGKLMLLLTLLSVLCNIGVGFLSSRIASGFSRNLRKAVFSKVESFSSGEFEKFSTASLITRTTNDITQIQMVVIMMVRMVFYAPIIGVGGVMRAINKDSSMWWILALAVGILILLIIIIFQSQYTINSYTKLNSK